MFEKRSGIDTGDEIMALPTFIKKPLAAAALATTMAAGLVAAPAGEAAAASPVRVTAAGDLFITTTNASEEIFIADQRSGSFSITIETDDSSQQFDVDGVTRNVTIRTRGGDDHVNFLQEPYLPNNLTVDLGSGDNELHLTWDDNGGAVVEGNLRVVDSAGDLLLNIHGIDVKGRSTFSTGSGHTHYGSNSSVYRDDVTVTASTTGSIRWGAHGDDYLDRFRLTGGNGVDTIRFSGSTELRGITTVDTRGGNDEVELKQSARAFRPLTIRLGGGHDDLFIKPGVRFDHRFSLNAGSGNDFVSVFGATFGNRSTFAGGSGSDQLTGEASTFAFSPVVSSFEIE